MKKEKFKKLILLFLLSFIIPHQGIAQGFDSFSPEVGVTIKHPPKLGLKIDKVVFFSDQSECARQVTDALVSLFVDHNVQVIDRENLDRILAEHNLSLSGYIDGNTAASIGKILGPSALMNIKVLRCTPEIKDNLYRDEEYYDADTKSTRIRRVYVSRTTFYLKISIQVTDLNTGRIFAAKVYNYDPSLTNESYSGQPEEPSPYEVQELALSYLKSDVSKLFFDWEERAYVNFFKSKKCNLNAAFKALANGEIDEAFEISKKNLETCKNTPNIKEKHLAHAYLNLGVMYFIKNDYDKALTYLNEAKKLRPGRVVNQAIKAVKYAQEEAEKYKRVEKNAERIKMQEKSNQMKVLTNDDIIQMTKNHLPEAIIIQKIKTTPCKFDVSTEALAKLNKNGVSEKIILLMMEKK